jgi:hypothetical protein
VRRRSRSFSTTDQAGLAVQERNGQQFGGAARHQFGKAVDDLPARDLRACRDPYRRSERKPPALTDSATLVVAPYAIRSSRGRTASDHLWTCLGRQSGSAPGYHYSTAMAGAHITWDDASLDRFLSSTMNVVHGTKMFPAVPAETGNITWPNILR